MTNLRRIGLLLGSLLLLSALPAPAAAASHVDAESFEDGRVPAEWSVTGTDKVAVARGPASLVKDGEHSLRWQQTGGALKFTATSTFDTLSLWVRPALYQPTSTCVSIGLGSVGAIVRFRSNEWLQVNLQASPNRAVEFGACEGSTGIVVIDLVTTSVREAEATLVLLPGGDDLGVVANDSGDLDLQAGPTTISSPVNLPPGLGTTLTVPPPAPLQDTRVGFRHNDTYATPATTVSVPFTTGTITVRLPVAPSLADEWQSSGTGLVLYAGGREVAFVPLVGQAWVLA